MQINIFVIASLVSIKLFAFSGNSPFSASEKLFFSHLDKEYLQEFHEEGWVTFIKQIGKDKLSLKFPVQPTLMLGNDSQVYRAEDGEVQYLFSMEDFEGGESTQDEAYWDQGKYHQLRIQSTSGKRFTFLTISENVGDNNHKFFIESFHIIHPLGGL